MSVPQSLATPARTALRLVGLIAILFGLVGMHGLANHGLGGMANMPQVMVQASAGTVGSTVGLVSVGQSDVTGPLAEAVPGPATVTSGHKHRGMGMNTTGLCVAILAVGLFGLLLLLRDRRAPRALWFLARRVFAVRPGGRDHDPPSLTVLSIQRC